MEHIPSITMYLGRVHKCCSSFLWIFKILFLEDVCMLNFDTYVITNFVQEYELDYSGVAFMASFVLGFLNIVEDCM